jgi:hypothetical protein
VSYRRTLVFLIIFLALGIVFFFREIRGGAIRRHAEEQKKRILPFEAGDASSLAIRRAEDGTATPPNVPEIFVIRESGGGWDITTPVNAPAETGTVDEMLDTLSGLMFERDLGPQSDLVPFGLEPPGIEIEVSGGQGSLGSISLGGPTVDGSKSYVKTSASDSVFAVKKSVRDSLDKSLFELRDKTLFEFSPSDVQAIAVAGERKLLSFEIPGEDGWKLTFPEKHRADSGMVVRLIDAVKSARVRKFVEEEAADVEKYGLGPTATRVEFRLVERIAVLYLGAVGDDDSETIFARVDDGRRIVEIDSGILSKLSPDVDTWRNKTLLPFEKDTVTRIRVASKGGEMTAERSADDPGKWMVVKPETALGDAEDIDGLLSYMSRTNVTRFIRSGEELDAAGRALEEPAARVQIWIGEENSPRSLFLSERTQEYEYYARTEPGGQFSIIREELLDELVSDPERLKDKSVLAFLVEEIEGYEIVKGDKVFPIKRRDKDHWILPEGIGILEYDAQIFLWDLEHLDYSTLLPRSEGDSSYGFDSPTIAITLTKSDTGEEMALVVGKPIPGRDAYYALGVDPKVVMEIEGGSATDWFDKF